METLTNLWETALTFLQEGYNLYYCIGGVVVVILAIIIIVVAAKKKGKKDEIDDAEFAEYDTPASENVEKKEELVETVAPYGDHSAALAPVNAEPIVEVEPEEIEPAILVSDDEPSEQAEQEIIKSVVVKPVKTRKVKPTAEPVASVEPEAVEATEKGEYKRSGYAQIYKDKGGKFRFRIKASNQNIVAHSQDYTTKSACKNGIKAVAHAADKAIIADTTKIDYVVTIGKPAFEVFRGANEKFYFRLRAANTNNLLSSQGYTTKDNCLNGIRSVTFLSHNHTLIDDTLNK